MGANAGFDELSKLNLTQPGPTGAWPSKRFVNHRLPGDSRRLTSEEGEKIERGIVGCSVTRGDKGKNKLEQRRN